MCKSCHLRTWGCFAKIFYWGMWPTKDAGHPNTYWTFWILKGVNMWCYIKLATMQEEVFTGVKIMNPVLLWCRFSPGWSYCFFFHLWYLLTHKDKHQPFDQRAPRWSDKVSANTTAITVEEIPQQNGQLIKMTPNKVLFLLLQEEKLISHCL